MRNLLNILVFIVTTSTYTFAQYSISGTVTNQRGEYLELASVFVVRNNDFATITDRKGRYTLENLPSGVHIIKCSYVGYESRSFEVDLKEDLVCNVMMKGAIFGLDTIEVIANRVGEDAVYSYTDMDKSDIEVLNLGKDIPYILSMTPSTVMTSDAGTGIGYTGLRVRGTDATRVNVTINGVGLNDAESQGVFWVNMPDFASSVENVQIQRGVGPSTSGAGAFGATISLSTLGTSINPGIMVDATIGSYGTRKLTFGLQSGLINDMYAVDIRFSDISSDGYIDRATADLKSYYVSVARITDRSSLRFIAFSGDEVTYQSWYGTPQSVLEGNQAEIINHFYRSGLYQSKRDSINLFNADRKYNYYNYDNQVDDYGQDHYQLHYSRQINSKWMSKWTAHYTKGAGFFEEYKSDIAPNEYQIENAEIGWFEDSPPLDLVRRRWLDNDYYGAQWHNELTLTSGIKVQFGGAASRYLGDHFGRVVRFINLEVDRDILNRRYYSSESTKDDANAYAKAKYQVSDKFNLTTDLQIRKVNYTAMGIDNDLRIIDIDTNFSFFNPKFGANYQLTKYDELYASYAIANREPDRVDFIDNPLNSQPSHETLYDTEIGYRRTSDRYAFSVNGYYMKYDNQLVSTGQLNDSGSAIRTNVKDSYRLGVEAVAGIQLMKPLRWEANVTLSQNKIANLTEVLYDYTNGFDVIQNTLEDTDISFSPSVVAASMLTYDYKYGLSALLNTKYVGKQYLDNTNNENRSISAYLVNDLGVNYKSQMIGADATIQLMVYNLLNEKYVSNGYTYSYIFDELITENFYYPQAERHFMLRLKVTL